jgi:hypothetical protein
MSFSLWIRNFFQKHQLPNTPGLRPTLRTFPVRLVSLKAWERYEQCSKVFQQSVSIHIFYQVTLVYLPFGLARDNAVNDSEEDQKVVANQVIDYKYDE